MRTKRLLTLVVLGATVLVAAAIATAARTNDPTNAARAATAQFRDVSVATAAGYGEFRDAQGIACIELADGSGGMGVHYVKGALVGDTVLDPEQPEALVYELRPYAGLKLAALEYIVFKDAWDAEHIGRPSLFGREFDFTPSPNRYGIPAFYALHAWVFKNNRDGVFAPYNPKVDC
jgi:hypothetical protein